MAEEVTERVSRYILDGSDQNLRRLLRGAELGAENTRAAFRRVGFQHGWNAIDCGCGPLGGLAVLAEMAGPAGRVVGVDVSPAAVQQARAVVAALELGERGSNRRRPARPGCRGAGRPVRSGLYAAVPDAPGRPGTDPPPHRRSPSPWRPACRARAAAQPAAAIAPAPGSPHRLLGFVLCRCCAGLEYRLESSRTCRGRRARRAWRSPR